MTRGWRVPAAWGLLLLAGTAAQLPFGPPAIELALLGGAGLATELAALVLLVRERRTRVAELASPTRVPDLSPPSVALALGLSAAVVGAETGIWLVLMGAGLACLGLGGLVRERRAERP